MRYIQQAGTYMINYIEVFTKSLENYVISSLKQMHVTNRKCEFKSFIIIIKIFIIENL